MPRQTIPSRRSHRLPLLAAGAFTAIALTACSSGPDSTPTTSTHTTARANRAPRGVVTVQEASRLLTAYENSNNRANKVRSEEILAKVEGGQLNAQSRADYRQFKTWSAKQQAYYGSPFRYTHRSYMIPPAGTATWFAVKAVATGTKSKSPSLLIFDKDGPAYKMVLALYVDKSTIPAVALDKNGLAKPADPATPVGSLAPAQLSSAFEDLAETGGKKTGKKLASTPAVKDARTLYTNRGKRDDSKYATTKYFATKVKASKVYALHLADGGVLAAFPTAHNQETLLRPAYRSNYKINPNKVEALYNPAGRTVITDEFQGQALATLTPSGTPHVLAYEYRMVDSR
ncbi:hypothetical protein ACICHK_00465 [Streptomyces sp. AHU1]|uniref:hypothetical protein n=1 Tax=Streptomyces sp. AHU1 TaxID=3377215 RepID=UPI003877D5C3